MVIRAVEDQDNIPVDLIDRFGAEAARQGADYRYQVYPGAGHGFLQGLVEKRTDSASAHDGAIEACAM